MNLSQKSNLLELLKTIQSGITYAKKNARQQSSEMLDDCLAALEAVRDMLEAEKDIPVQSLEKVEGAKARLTSARAIVGEGNRYGAQLHQAESAIVKLAQSVGRGVQPRLKVVFMPYSASMWSALESVWRAFVNDAGCDTSVVPIPYDELDENGFSLKRVCEWDRFPSEVPITPYTDYHLEAEQPDVIFLHNPYDGANNVTRVDPAYFSTNLVKTCRRICYIPYFIGTNINPNQMFYQPVHQAAWRIFTQSEGQRLAYIKAGHAKERIVALGSPKVDKALDAFKDGVAMPQAWASKLQDRTIILYNTHMLGFYAHQLAFTHFDNAMSWFMYMKQYGVIWRPHPLTVSGMRSRAPWMLPLYTALVERCQSSENIVVDLSGDYYPAMALAHAYAGNHSSIDAEFALSGKPLYVDLEKEAVAACEWLVDISLFDHPDEQRQFYLPQFLEALERGEDPHREIRLASIRKAFDYPDGQAGRRIHDYVVAEALKEKK